MVGLHLELVSYHCVLQCCYTYIDWLNGFSSQSISELTRYMVVLKAPAFTCQLRCTNDYITPYLTSTRPRPSRGWWHFVVSIS
jgi:hypothetical protein